jgi:hypothetical protein
MVLLAMLAALHPCADLDVAFKGQMGVVDARPVVTWREVWDSKRYRIEMESRVPEGPVLLSLDTQVSQATFQPAVRLTEARAAVKIRITAGCSVDDGSRLRYQAATYHIDTSPLCPAPARIAPTTDGKAIEWPVVAGAVRYDVTLLTSHDGAIVVRGRTQQPRFALPAEPETVAVVVRPYCPTGFGPYGSALVTKSKP